MGPTYRRKRPLTDAEAVQAALNGDMDAYTELVDRYRSITCGLAYHFLRHFEDARDVAQEAFIQAYLHLGQLREPHRFGAWLRQLTINECRMWQRRQRLAEPHDACIADGRACEEEIHTRLLVWQALECLSEASRRTLILFY